MQPSVYVTPHIHSKIVCSAFAEGCGGRLTAPGKLAPGTAVVYGVLRGCGDIVRQCDWVGRDYIHIDHGYFRRGHHDGYYRCTWNGLQEFEFERKPDDRWRKLKLPIKPWRRTGETIVVCPLSSVIGDFLGVPSWPWTEAVVKELSLYTDRKIVIKPKDTEASLEDSLKDAWALVTYNSNAAVEAALMGVPVFVLGESAALPVGSDDLSAIETPVYPDRRDWAASLAYSQFTLDEMKDGTAWRLLND